MSVLGRYTMNAAAIQAEMKLLKKIRGRFTRLAEEAYLLPDLNTETLLQLDRRERQAMTCT